MRRTMTTDRRRRPPTRRGAAAVELAILLPILCFIAFLAIDYGRVVPAAMTVADCARHGALYAADPTLASSTPYATVEEAALASAEELSPSPTVATAEGTDANGADYVEVTVSYTFRTLGYPGIPDSIPLSRTVRMPVAPD